MSNEQFEEGLEKQLENMLGFSPGTEAGNPSQATSVSSQAGEQVPPEEGKQQKKPGKKKKKGRRIALMILLPVAVLLCVYLVFAYQYQDKFFRGTIINGVDCGGMTVSQVEDRLEKLTEDYSLAITFRDGKTEKLQGDEIGYSYVSDGSVQEIKDRQVPILSLIHICSGFGSPFGLPRWEQRITLPPSLTSFLMVGRAATRRFSSVIFPSFKGTLKSQRTRTLFPFTLISSTDFLFSIFISS